MFTRVTGIVIQAVCFCAVRFWCFRLAPFCFHFALFASVSPFCFRFALRDFEVRWTCVAEYSQSPTSYWSHVRNIPSHWLPIGHTLQVEIMLQSIGLTEKLDSVEEDETSTQVCHGAM